MSKKAKFLTVGQIDATGVRGPHEKELNDIGKANVEMFKDLSESRLKEIVEEDLGAELKDIGFNEDWTINIQFFPEANIHISYFYYGDEFGDIEAEMKFLFSGKRVHWIPGEDSATFIDIIMDFLERRIKKKEPFEKNYGEKTELMGKVLKQRQEPFQLLKESDIKPLEKFLGAEIEISEGKWKILRKIFPEIFVKVIFNKEKKELDISFSGDNIEKIGSYHIELIGIFIINHILRYISTTYQEEDLPDICDMMFSRYYMKKKEED